MSDKKTVDEIALQLRNAIKTGTPIPPIREIIGVEDIETAYAIQRVNTQHRISKGARIVGKKIGLTSKAVQTQLGVDQPDYGMLFNTMEVLTGDTIPWNELMQPKVEAEIAFILGKDLDHTSMTVSDVISAIDYAVASIEIVGSRIQNWDIKITDTVADNASASHFVIGHRPVKLKDFDLINCQMSMDKNGKTVSKGTGASCLGSPINATLWLARTMAHLGEPLRKGELVLTGAMGPMSKVEKGDQIVARFYALGEVSINF